MLMTSSELYQWQGPYFQIRSHSQVLGAYDFKSLMEGDNTIYPITTGKLKSEIRAKTKMKGDDKQFGDRFI